MISDIEWACEQIQKYWSEKQRRERSVEKDQEFTIPECKLMANNQKPLTEDDNDWAIDDKPHWSSEYVDD